MAMKHIFSLKSSTLTIYFHHSKLLTLNNLLPLANTRTVDCLHTFKMFYFHEMSNLVLEWRGKNLIGTRHQTGGGGKG